MLHRASNLDYSERPKRIFEPKFHSEELGNTNIAWFTINVIMTEITNQELIHTNIALLQSSTQFPFLYFFSSSPLKCSARFIATVTV
jgi:hypothetical protein